MFAENSSVKEASAKKARSWEAIGMGRNRNLEFRHVEIRK